MGKAFKPWPPKPAGALPLDGMNGDFVNHESSAPAASKKGKATVAPGEAKPGEKKKADAAPAAKADAIPAVETKTEAKPAKK